MIKLNCLLYPELAKNVCLLLMAVKFLDSMRFQQIDIFKTLFRQIDRIFR